ncbi:hypothetical protein C2G38_2202363 [Gigaspora rosea]|uniref:HAT C-terminal dimerisation domain-containing protein n=1 Tax=Gigaspora rosea TaxID=44941 RepID=A0A397UNM3_9GLOM|nr:hypothetical protein C2G38_2202363 [Gigaspora rosea]
MDSRIHETIDASLRIYALCDEFWEDLDLVTNILQPIVAILKIFESDNTMHLSIYSNFRKMINTIQDISCNFLNEIQSSLWWESWPDSRLKQLAIKVLKIPTSKTNQEINHEIYDENREVENIIYTEGICGDIDETEQIYSSDIENNSTMEFESEYSVIYT